MCNLSRFRDFSRFFSFFFVVFSFCATFSVVLARRSVVSFAKEDLRLPLGGDFGTVAGTSASPADARRVWNRLFMLENALCSPLGVRCNSGAASLAVVMVQEKTFTSREGTGGGGRFALKEGRGTLPQRCWGVNQPGQSLLSALRRVATIVFESGCKPSHQQLHKQWGSDGGYKPFGAPPPMSTNISKAPVGGRPQP